MLVVRGAGAVPRPRVQAIRLAVSNLSRPGAATTSVILSLGFGVTVLAAVALIENNLSGEVRQRSEEHTSELQSLMRISYAVFCLKKKRTANVKTTTT